MKKNIFSFLLARILSHSFHKGIRSFLTYPPQVRKRTFSLSQESSVLKAPSAKELFSKLPSHNLPTKKNLHTTEKYQDSFSPQQQAKIIF
jgi:hypothetical protein